MIERQCKECGKWVDQKFLVPDSRCPDGFRPFCRDCRNEQQREWRKKKKPTAERRGAHGGSEKFREQVARKLCSAVTTYWHIAETNPRFGVAMIGGGYAI